MDSALGTVSEFYQLNPICFFKTSFQKYFKYLIVCAIAEIIIHYPLTIIN